MTESWNHWQSSNAWPQSVNPGYPAESNRTTWFYHQWPTPNGVLQVNAPATTEPSDLKAPPGALYRPYHWESVGTIDAGSVRATGPASLHHTSQTPTEHRDYLPDLKKFTRWPNSQKAIRNEQRNTIVPGNAPSLGVPLRRVGESTRGSTSPPPTPDPSYIRRTMPPVVSVENIQNEVLSNSLQNEK